MLISSSVHSSGNPPFHHDQPPSERKCTAKKNNTRVTRLFCARYGSRRLKSDLAAYFLHFLQRAGRDGKPTYCHGFRPAHLDAWPLHKTRLL
jgi:hypothetical protein